MASSTRSKALRRLTFAAQAILLGLAGLAHAATIPDQPFDLAADVQNSNLRTDEHELRGNVRVTQGTSSIESQVATASALQTDHSKWTFEQSVHIRTPEAELRSNSASASFQKGQIAEARATGSPAYFEQLGGPPDKQVKGRAGVIEYDFVNGVVRLSDNVWFSYGGNEFRTNKVIYNLRDERVIANPEGQDSGRVNITVRPKNGELKLNSRPKSPDASKPQAPAGKPGNGA